MASFRWMRRLLREIRERKSAADNNWFSREKTTTYLVRRFCDEKMSSDVETVLRFKRLTPNAQPPQKASACAAGYDLSSAYDYTIPPKEKECCMTDLQLLLPQGCYGRIAPRSGLAHKHFIDVGAGVIDYDYRGNVSVILFNFGNKEFSVKKGDRIAQIICERIFYPEIEEVENIEDTERGGSGFGSSGTN